MSQRKSSSPVISSGKNVTSEVIEENENDKKKKPSKHKWVPLEIDLTKAGKRDQASKQKSGDAQSTVSEGDRDWREARDNHNSRHPRPNSAAPRGRGRNRGGRRGPFSKSAHRMSSDTDFSDYPADFSQVLIRLHI